MRKWMTVWLTLVLTFSLVGCNKAGSPNETPTETSPDPIQVRISEMSVEDKVGQLVIVGLEGTTMQPETREIIEQYRVGGFILYKNNISSIVQTKTLLQQLKETNRPNPAPLWLSVDQEGGKVNRMPAEIENQPTAQQVSEIDDLKYTKQIGLAIGEEIGALGFNMNFAPVLDVNSNPANPVIGDRSYGKTPEAVIRHGLETMRAIQSTRIVAVVKHFPGHGDTSVDSHLELPVVNKSLDELRAFELRPFVEAIDQGADAFMVAHILLPKVDERAPASLSQKVITDLLRDNLQFNGVVITDDMTMGGITKHYDIGEAAVISVLAGSDIILVGHDHSEQLTVIKALQKSVENGTITIERLNQSVSRILALKSKYLVGNEQL